MPNRKVNPDDFDISICRICNACKKSKSLDNFHIERTAKYGRSTICIECQRWRYIKNVHGLTKEQFLFLLEEQNYQCPICKRGLSLETKINIDHDHRCCASRPYCGKCVRGLLCDLCNRGLGQFKDSIELLENALEYMKFYGCIYAGSG